jgi:hypothetical protein
MNCCACVLCVFTVMIVHFEPSRDNFVAPFYDIHNYNTLVLCSVSFRRRIFRPVCFFSSYIPLRCNIVATRVRVCVLCTRVWLCVSSLSHRTSFLPFI